MISTQNENDQHFSMTKGDMRLLLAGLVCCVDAKCIYHTSYGNYDARWCLCKGMHAACQINDAYIVYTERSCYHNPPNGMHFNSKLMLPFILNPSRSNGYT